MAFNRMAWRLALRNYDAGGYGRLNDGWNAINTTGPLMDRTDRDIIRARAQDLERNSDISESIIRAFIRNVVGSGFRLQARIKGKDGALDEALNTCVEDAWKEFCKPRNCDIQGRQSFSEMCRMAVRRLRVDGGICIIKTYTSSGSVPLKLQMKEVSELDTTLQMTQYKNGNYIVDGIEVDGVGRHVAYWFRRYTPDGYQQIDSERITADRVIYLQKFTRPSQVREMCPMTQTITRIRDTNQYMEAVSVQARIAACLCIFFKKILPGTFGRGAAATKSDTTSGYEGQTISPGMMLYGQPGEEATAINPPAIGSSAKEMLAIQQRLAGSGQGLSYETTSRDMSQTNYSSARQGLIEDGQEYEIEQQYLIDHLLSEVYTSFLIALALVGAMSTVTVTELLADKSRYMAHEFIPKGRMWIDPLKESMANKVALETGQTTLARICAGAGTDWQEEAQQRAREIEYMKSLGIMVDATLTVDASAVADDNARAMSTVNKLLDAQLLKMCADNGGDVNAE